MAKRYTYEDDFEMVYLRHEYAAKLTNPQESWVYEFEPIVGQTARIMYDKLRPNFDKVGFDLDDIKTITNMYMIYYMDIYSLRSNRDAYDRVVEKFMKRHEREPSKEEIARKDRNNLINFLKQRLQHCCTVCSRKARNITVGSDRRAAFALTPESQSASEELIMTDYKRLGYRKITKAELKEAKLNMRDNKLPELVDKNGFRIIEVELLNNGITDFEWKGLYVANKKDPYNRDPEEMYSLKEDEILLEGYTKKFKNMTDESKKRLLKRFIDSYKGKKLYREEVKQAKKMLAELKYMV